MQIKSIIAFAALVLSGSVLAAPVNTSELHEFDARAVTGIHFTIGGSFATQKKNKAQDEVTAKTTVQSFLNTVQAAGKAVPNGVAVTITDKLHKSPSDSNQHVTFKMTDQALCGSGPCTGHAYTNGKGKLWNSSHKQVY